MVAYLQGFSSPKDAHWAATEINVLSLGRVFEDVDYGGQLHKLVDAAAIAGDVVYYKGFTGSFEVTPTIANSSSGEVAGVITASVAQNEYCYVLKKGIFNSKANGVFADGMPVWADTGNNRVVPGGRFSGALSAAADTAGAIMSVPNPLTGAWLVTSLIINRTTKSTGAGTADFGIAAGATTLNDGLIDGLDLNAAAAITNNFIGGGTNGKAAQYGAAATFLTGSTASGNVAGLVGTYAGTFVPAPSDTASTRVIGIALGTIDTGKVSVMWDLPYTFNKHNDQ